MSGNPLLLEMLAGRVQEEHLEDARRERLIAQADRARERTGHALLSAVRRGIATAGQHLAHLRSATSVR